MKYLVSITLFLLLLSCGGGKDIPIPAPGGGNGNEEENGGANQNEDGGGYADRKKYVFSVEELNALSGLMPGDTVVLADGTYASKTISVKADGSVDDPIIFMAAHPGKVVLTGNSSLTFAGSNLVFSGFRFRDVMLQGGKAVIEFRLSSSAQASGCRVTECAVTGRNTVPDEVNDSKWVSIYGSNNRVDHCTFDDKKNIGCLMVVWLPSVESPIPPAHRIDHNYFCRPSVLLDGNQKEINGQETIRIGTSDTSMQNAGCSVDGNMFYMCDGEIEIISNKSCFNTYRGNYFRKCRATLTLRHGNDCLVEENIFVGDNISGSGGTRVIGERHTVRNNHYENLGGSGYRTAICLMTGIVDSPANGYLQVKNTLVAGNTIVNCANGINVSYGKDGTLPAIGTTITGNTISNISSKNTAIQVNATAPPTEVTWSGNTVWGGKYSGITASQVPTTTVRPDIAPVDGRCADIESACGVTWDLNN